MTFFDSGVEQAMQMHDEITHLRIVDRLACLSEPGFLRLFEIGIDADNVEACDILEGNAVEVCEFAAEDQMKKLFRLFLGCLAHDAASCSKSVACRVCDDAT